MTATWGGGSPDVSALGVLGFSTGHETLYRLLLRNSGCTLEQLAPLAGLPMGELREHVARISRAGLVELRGETVVARPPEEALAPLISEEVRRVQNRTEQLEAVRGLLPSLSADHLSATVPRGEPTTIEVVQGGGVAQLMRSLSASSAGDLLWLRPDPWKVAPVYEIDDWVVDLLRSGRRSSAIYAMEVLTRSPEVIRRRAEAGERVRVLTGVPTRLAVLGRSAALISERFEVVDDRRLVLRQQSLVAALIMLFEHLWDRALPVPGLQSEPYDEAGARRLLLTQLAGGAKDEQMARAFGTSVRTVRRRVADLLDELGAISRFQAGVEAARRGWV
jgi:hypothetical protein